MSCAPTDRVLQTLRVHVPGATDDLLSLELFNTIDEFLRRTSGWKEDVDIDVSTGETEFPMPLPTDSALVRVMSATYNNMPVPATGSSVVQSSIGTVLPEQQFPDGDAMFAPAKIDIDPPTHLFTYAVYRPTYVSVTNPPVAAPTYPFHMTLALTIAKQCLECDCGEWSLPEWMFDMYFKEFMDGTLARCYSMPAKPWRDMNLAVYHGKAFRARMAERKQEAVRGFQYDVQTWRYPRAGWP